MRRLLQLWIQEMDIVGFEYVAGFRIQLQSETSIYDERRIAPQTAVLDFKSDWWVGNKAAWGAFLAALPYSARRGEADEPGKAYQLMRMIGARIEQIVLDADGALHIATSDSETLSLAGQDTIWDESWMFYVPPNSPGMGEWFIVCDSAGVVRATWPQSLSLEP